MAPVSAVTRPSFVVVLLLWFFYHVFLSSALLIEPPFNVEVTNTIMQYSRIPSLVEEQRKLFQDIDWDNLPEDVYDRMITELSQPNPIPNYFPKGMTGVINGTYAVLPIDYELARSIIPRRYGILDAGIRRFLPYLPRDKYPLFLSTGIYHDITIPDARLGDFSYAQFRFPFVDLLGDGHSHFSYIPSSFMSKHPMMVKLHEVYGEKIVDSTFQPPGDAYEFVPAGKANQAGEIFFNAYQNDVSVLNTTYTPRSTPKYIMTPYELLFYANVTNQPSFSCNSADCELTCDLQMHFFRTKVSLTDFTPVNINGSVSLANSALSNISIFPDGLKMGSVYGIKLAVAFLEYDYLDCQLLKGFEYGTRGDAMYLSM